MTDLRWEDLTPKERKAYINQDCVKSWELIPPRGVLEEYVSANVNDDVWGLVNLDTSKKIKNIIITLYKDGKQSDEIAYHVPYSLRQIQRIIKDFKDNITIKNRIIELHKAGVSKKQILIKLKCAKNYIDQVLRESLTTE